MQNSNFWEKAVADLRKTKRAQKDLERQITRAGLNVNIVYSGFSIVNEAVSISEFAAGLFESKEIGEALYQSVIARNKSSAEAIILGVKESLDTNGNLNFESDDAKKAFFDVIQRSKELNEKESTLSDILCPDSYGIINIPNGNKVMLELLQNIFGDEENDWIGYFLWELDFGKNWKPGVVTGVGGEDIPLGTAEDLWNLLVRGRDHNNNSAQNREEERI